MRKFSVVFEGEIVSSSTSATIDAVEAEAHLDRVMEELLNIGAEDAAMGGTLSTGKVEISVTVNAEDLQAAQAAGSAAIRTAIHAAGGSTPGWSIDWCRVQVERFDLINA